VVPTAGARWVFMAENFTSISVTFVEPSVRRSV
jgi:hypothetical protein